jgi:putative ABC transport system ATP-binding protein
MLELRDVSKSYWSGPERIRAAEQVSLSVGAGEFVAITGPSGSGKTTLLLVIAGIVRPDSGTVTFNGTDVLAMSEKQAADYRLTNIGIVFQAVYLMPGATALDNTTVKLLGQGRSRRAARRSARPWLDRVGLAGRAKDRPSRLSTGERQRVAVARALANEPKLVLADEPTGNLDSRSGRTVLELLADACRSRGVAVVLATHDPAALEFADRSYELRDGRLSQLATDAAQDALLLPDDA